MSGSFESTGVSESPGELELRYTRPDIPLVEVEYLQFEEFSRNFNTPLTDIGDSILVQIRPLSQSRIGVPIGFVIENLGEGSRDMYTPTSTMLFRGVSPPHVSI